jgi:alkanesulfonate monooxygenase SsuD/methylene tetrahydromethanopterin reductase-like flavin-dependent oxidoreductase (luciferase family)
MPTDLPTRQPEVLAHRSARGEQAMPTETAVLAEARTVTADNSAVRGELSVFLGTPAGKDPGQVYRDALDTIQVADALGYSYAWVAEAHFSSLIGVPAALSLLAAATQVATRIRLGTAVVPLAFDNSLRLAETAALVNALSNQRLEFGVGKGNPRGFSTDAYNAFGLQEEDRNQLFARSLRELKDALRGTIHAGEKEVTLYPPAQDLLARIWQATGDHDTATAAGAAGDGLMLFRTTPEGVAGDVQDRLIDSYLSSFNSAYGDPRIGVSRSVLIGSSRREAIAIAAADLEARASDHPVKPQDTDATSIEAYLIEHDIAYGSVDDVVETLNGDAAVSRSTNYLFNFPFAPTGSRFYRDDLARVAAEVYPRLRRREDG